MVKLCSLRIFWYQCRAIRTTFAGSPSIFSEYISLDVVGTVYTDRTAKNHEAQGCRKERSNTTVDEVPKSNHSRLFLTVVRRNCACSRVKRRSIAQITHQDNFYVMVEEIVPNLLSQTTKNRENKTLRLLSRKGTI